MTLPERLRSPYAPPLFALLLSSGLLIGAWISQYGFGYHPCTMCYWQRHVHKAIILIAILTLLSIKAGLPFQKAMIYLLVLTFLGSAGLAFYHSGVEFKWWEGPKTCSGGSVNLTDFASGNPFDQLDEKIKPPSCDEAVWLFLGLSMATWNGIASLFGGIVTLCLGKKKHDAA